MLLDLGVLVKVDQGLREQGRDMPSAQQSMGAPGDCAADQGCNLKAPAHVQGRDAGPGCHTPTMSERTVAALRC